MKKIPKISNGAGIFLISFLFLLLFSWMPTQAQAAGLVPCGGGQDEKACTFCDFFVMTNGIIQFVMTVIVPAVAVLMLIVGGGLFFFAGVKPDLLQKAKDIIWSVVIGLLIIFAAFLIVGTILSGIGLADWTTQIYKNWWQDGFFQINCQ